MVNNGKNFSAMRIDAHQHFWSYNPSDYSWIGKKEGVLKQDFLPLQLKDELQKVKINGCLAVQANQSEKENEFLLSLANKYDFIKGVVGWIDLVSPNVEDRAKHFSKDKKFKGVRHILQSEKDEMFMVRPEFRRGISCLEKFNLTYDLLVYYHQLPVAITLVEQYPSQKFVLDHIGKPDIKKGSLGSWKKDIFKLASYQNVYCKLSGLVTEANWQDWSYQTFVQYMEVVLEAFGINRIMVGSDWPVCLLAANYTEVIEVAEKFFQNFTNEEKDKVFGKNASEFYNII